MKPASFAYHRPASVADAVALLAEHGDDAKPLAGGQSLVPILALRLSRFEHLVDLNHVPELRGVTRSNGTVRIGAMTTQAVVSRAPEVVDGVPLLALATPFIGHFQIRNRGTLGGSLAHADPAAEYPAVALALDAELDIVGPGGSRRVAAADFFESTWETVLADDELLVAAEFPVWGDGSVFAVEEVARRHGDFALAGAACGVQVRDGAVERAAISLFGVGNTPVRATTAEAALVQGADPEEVGRLAADDLDPPGDIHASGAYRKHVAAVVVRRALVRAMGEVQ